MPHPVPPTADSRLTRPISMLGFAVVACAPLILLALGAATGGWLLWLGLFHMAVLAMVLDLIVGRLSADAPEGAEFPGADGLLAGLGVGALALMALCSWAVAQPTLSRTERIGLVFGAGLWLGQVGHPAAHELIHRTSRPLFRLGQAFYGAILFGQHASAHRLVHHLHVGSDLDPNSAREGESFYRFAPRAWIGSYLAGLRAETALRARRSQGRAGPHPYVVQTMISLLGLGLAALLGGMIGFVVWLLMALHAQVQILVSDYVQHYGLRRRHLTSGRLEPVGLRHSWNGGHWFASALMLNAPRHSDHHVHPSRPYPALRLPHADDAPRLPWPLPVACAVAFWPRRWKRRLRPLLRAWSQQPVDHGPRDEGHGDQAMPQG